MEINTKYSRFSSKQKCSIVKKNELKPQMVLLELILKIFELGQSADIFDEIKKNDEELSSKIFGKKPNPINNQLDYLDYLHLLDNEGWGCVIFIRDTVLRPIGSISGIIKNEYNPNHGQYLSITIQDFIILPDYQSNRDLFKTLLKKHFNYYSFDNSLFFQEELI